MTSSVIHMCIAKKINEKLNFPLNMIPLGSIAPDISKHVGETKIRSHFLTDEKTEGVSCFFRKISISIESSFYDGIFYPFIYRFFTE